MIGYQYGKDTAILSAGDYALCPAKYFFMACDKSFIDQACSVKMAGCRAGLCFCVFMVKDRPCAWVLTLMYWK